MKTLHLLRHAKSAWDEHGLSDRERGLNKRGQRDAPRMGQVLATLVTPQPIAVSPATRAQLTLAGICEGWPSLAAQSHVTVEALYTFDEEAVLDWLREQADDRTSLFIIGHNPAFTDLVNVLAPAADLHNLPTAGYAQLELAIDRWSGLAAGSGVLAHSLFPRELPDS